MCATKYYQEQNIVHRDLKLLNILVTGNDSGVAEDLRIKIIDFGNAFMHSDKKVDLSTNCGTVDFMAPEIIEGTKYDKSCDMWSIGVIAYFLLCGMPPFFAKDDRAIA